MRRYVPIFALLFLGACGDPLASFEDVSDVTFADDAQIAVVPSQAELQRKPGILARLWQQPEDSLVQEAPASLVETAPQLSDATTENAPVFSEAEPEADTAKPRRSALGWLTGNRKPANSGETPELTAEPEKVAVLTETGEVSPSADVLAAEPGADGNVTLATFSPEPDSLRRAGLRSRNAATPKRSANSPDVAFGSVLPFGKVGRVCDAKSQPLGRKIETFGRRGQGYTLYDSAPESTGPRTFYVTGFDDKCPRQFTAALALFGAPRMHEQLRYGSPSVTYPYSETDQAYEKIKSRICGVGARKPCGKSIERLERNTVFVSTYERFTDNGRWADVLIHDSAVVAASIKVPGQRVQ